ncbi:hypothetical protein CVT24_011124 [Panaeolus cyanescens]|uniref:Uncharacterized protein n=1 Tax=Panaeolus cyanescens TaxID=181874 RepID=A0A409YG70_9AGAR|nr:hypothetical protein CVT24_011124 [Panaeolus cyanescens]
MRIPTQLVYLASLLSSANAGLVDDIVNAIKNAVTCASCHTLLGTLEPVALLGDKAFSATFVAVCKTLQIQDDDVCTGLINQQGPIIAHDLRSTSVLGQTSTKLCNALLGLCQEPDVNPVTMSFPKPAPLNPKAFVSTGKAPFQVVHLSDVHVDRFYEVGSDAQCTKPICCRTFPDSPSSIARPAGPLGSRDCDTPTSLMQSLLKAANAQNSKFNIFTGDVIEAALWLDTEAENTSDMQQFNQELGSFLDSPTFPAIGNHEAAPSNAFPRNTTDKGSVQWVFDTQSQGWSQWLDPTAASQVKHNSGSYSMVVPGTSLRIISLNTIYWYKLNFWLYDSDKQQPDPNGVLAFAIQQLQIAEDAGQRVWIVAHMAPSSGDCFKDQSNYFDQIVQRYKNTIAAQFYGHSHVDEFAISYSDWNNKNANTANSILYLAPSVTPRNADSSFRVYDVDPDTYEVMDSRTFIAEMSSPSFQVSPQWTQEYSARELYGQAIGGWPTNQPLNAAFWHSVTLAFESDDALFRQYISLKTRGVNVATCDSTCKTQTICNLRAGRVENGCHPTNPGFNFERRDGKIDTTARGHADHCEGTGLTSILTGATLKLQTHEGATLEDELRAALSQILSFDLVAVAMYVFEYGLTLEMEVNLVWSTNWNWMKVIFLLQRYLPFADTAFLIMYLKFGPGMNIVRYMMTSGTAFSELILFLMMIPGWKAYRAGGDSALYQSVYRDGLIYYVFLFALSTINIVVIKMLPYGYENLLTGVERCMHSILTSRVLLHIRQLGNNNQDHYSMHHWTDGVTQLPSGPKEESIPSIEYDDKPPKYLPAIVIQKQQVVSEMVA